jgi:glycosyltransferase involved in cell wall biosynthesis
MNNKLLSILIPTVPERLDKLALLLDSIKKQSGFDLCEVLYFGDNRSRTIGAKRNALLEAARGKYVAFCDDDDGVSEDYAQTLTEIASAQTVDVITFRQWAKWNTDVSEVHFSIQHNNEPFQPGGITKRFPWHVCAWERKLAQSAVFTEKQWGEDFDWVAQMAQKALREAHVPRVLHYYTHTDSGSLAH